MTPYSTTMLLGVSLMALAMPATALAQTTPAPAPTPAPVAPAATAAADPVVEDGANVTPSDIIVTARRRDESIQDVPAVVNAVTAEDFQKLNLRNFTEVAQLVPGLSLTTAALGVGGNAQIRGVNFDIFSSGNNPTVEFYLNDAPITAGVILQQAFDIGQVEVLRGPQGTLRGRASPSGSITVTTRKPDLYQAGGYVNITANDIGTQNVNGGLSIPIIEGIAAIRVAGLYNVDEANRVRTIDGRRDGRDPYSRTASGRVTALVTPTDFLRFEGSYQRLDRRARFFDQNESFNVSNSAAAASPVLIRGEDRESFMAAPRRVRQVYDIYNGRAQASAAGQTLIYQFQHYTQKINTFESQDAANLFPTVDLAPLTFSDISSTSHEIRLQNEERVAGIFDYVVGYFDNKNSTPTTLIRPTVVRLPLAFGGGVAQVVPTPVGRLGDSHEKSIFGNVTAHIGDFQLSGGLRRIDYSAVGQLLVNNAVIATDRQDSKKFIYTGSAQYNFTPDVMVYASTGSSFRPGIAAVGDFNLARSALENSFLILPPETSKSYEAGFKTSLFDRRVRLNVSTYYQKFKNYPYRSGGSGVYYVNTVSNGAGGTAQQPALFNFVGAVPVTVKGIEGELGFDVTRQWNVSLVASYSDGKIKNGTIPCTDLNGDGAPDIVTTAPTLAQLQAAVGANNLSACSVTQRSSNQSPFSATVQSEYSLPISGKVDGYLRGIFSFNGNSINDPVNRFDSVENYGLLNLFTGIRDPKGAWEVSLYAKNVLDTFRVLSQTDPLSTSYQQLPGAIIGGVPTITGRPSAATFTSSYVGVTTTQPREFGLNVRFAFGSR